MSTLPTGRFDAFLYSAIDDDHNGMPLTVLSAFARKDLDPWDEAESLLLLGPDRATRKLAEFIRGLPPGPTPRTSAEVIAMRLIGLLTRSRAAPVGGSSPRVGEERRASAQPALPAAAAQTKPRTLVHYLLFYLLFVAVLVGSQWLSPSSEPQARAETAPASVPAAAAAPSSLVPSARENPYVSNGSRAR